MDELGTSQPCSQGFPTEEGRALELAGRARNEARYFVLDKELLDASPIKCHAPFKLSMP